MRIIDSGSSVHLSRAWSTALLGVLGMASLSAGFQDPGGPEVLARGPIHEAFAAPVVYNPTPGVVVPKPPPSTQIEEQPPAQKPQGGDVEWVPGYWAWDDERNDYLWISGIWRDIPPGRQWVPGYWDQVDGGYRWTSGFWSPLASNGQVSYLPPPPQSLEVGPNIPQPGPDFLWSPGSWTWSENRYVWRPGYWVQAQPEWVWVPPSYVPTPSGYIYLEGYWDYPVARRGLVFAPVVFGPSYVAQPAYVYTPSIVLSIAGLTANLFIRPSYGHYYFGDYYVYAGAGPRSGYVPWFAYQRQRLGYDPLYATMAVNHRRDPAWDRQIRAEYQYRIEHREARPSPTFEGQRVLLEQRRSRGEDVRGMEIAHSLDRAGNHPETGQRLEPVRPEQRVEIARRQAAVREVQQERSRVETQARTPADLRPEEHRPQHLELPRSPVAARPASRPGVQDRSAAVPPQHPEGHQAFRPTFQGQPHREPRPGPSQPEVHRDAKPRSPHDEPRPRTGAGEPHKEPKPKDGEHTRPGR